MDGAVKRLDGHAQVKIQSNLAMPLYTDLRLRLQVEGSPHTHSISSDKKPRSSRSFTFVVVDALPPPSKLGMRTDTFLLSEHP